MKLGERLFETERLRLRPLRLEDAEPSARAMTKDVARNLLTFSSPWTVEQARERIRSSAERLASREAVDLAIVRRSDDRLLGWLGFALIVDRPEWATIGFWLATEHRGRGVVTEAGAAALPVAAAFLGIRHVEAAAAADNARSHGVLRRLGFSQTGERTAYYPVRGEEMACRVFALDLPERR